MSKHYYTKQQDEFILNADNVCLEETLDKFYELFNVKATKSMLYNRLKTLLGKNIKMHLLIGLVLQMILIKLLIKIFLYHE